MSRRNVPILCVSARCRLMALTENIAATTASRRETKSNCDAIVSIRPAAERSARSVPKLRGPVGGRLDEVVDGELFDSAHWEAEWIEREDNMGLYVLGYERMLLGLMFGRPQQAVDSAIVS